MTRWHYVAIVVLLLILGGLVWYSPTPLLTDLIREPDTRLKQFPSAYLTNTKTSQYNSKGAISHILTADRMRYFDGIYNIADGTVLIDKPFITFYSDSPDEDPWTASSLEGKGNQNIDELLLTGNVELKQSPNSTEFITITSEEMLLKPELQYAETSKPVMIKNESGMTTADGMKMSLKNGIIEFPANVRSQYHVR